MLQLYLVRHGWTAWHSERRAAGWIDVPLDEQGVAEAAATGRWLARHCPSRPVALLSSPVLRARQTAELIAAAFEPPLDRDFREGLAETRMSHWEGRLIDDIIASEPVWQEFYQGPADFRFPGGETGREVRTRIVAVVEALRRQHPRGSALLVSHADPLRGLIAHYLGLNLNLYYRLRITCGSISRLSLSDPNQSGAPTPPARLDFLNLVEHLPPKQSTAHVTDERE